MEGLLSHYGPFNENELIWMDKYLHCYNIGLIILTATAIKSSIADI